MEHGAVGLIVLHTPRDEKNFPWEDNYQYLGTPGMSWVGDDGMPDSYFPELKGAVTFNMDAAEVLFLGAETPVDTVFEADLAQEPVRGFPLEASRDRGQSPPAQKRVPGVQRPPGPSRRDSRR